STVVAILVHPGGANIAHVGDSRVYRVHGSQVMQITRDHSLVEQLVAAGALTPEQAAGHPDANQIVRALGMKAEVDVELSSNPVQFVAGDAFILCSDGMSDLVKPEDLLQIVGTAPAAQVAGQLVDLANARGGHDNITVQVMRMRESSDAPVKPLAPTIAEPVGRTIVEGPLASPQAAPPGPDRTTFVPPVPAAAPRRVSGSPTAIEDEAEAAHRSPAVIIGVVIAIAGLVLAGIAINLETSRKSKHNADVTIDLDAGAVVPVATLSEPTATPSAPTTEDAGALAPLAPPTHTHHGHGAPSADPDVPLPPVPTSTSL
ncbi:MAG: PP2C family protein-serine/threonine phosphatase, partial [Polyangiaceae bacterium]